MGSTVNIHIKLPQRVYENVRWLHGNLSNITSAAQIVRRCIFLMLIPMQQYGWFRGAIDALRRLNEAIQCQRGSRDEHGFMRNRMGMSQLLVGEQDGDEY